MTKSATIKKYYWLTKPGIIYGNAITVMAGFFLAARGEVDFGLFIATLLGISLVIASSCVFNNYIDRKIDTKMARTKKRAVASGEISGSSALFFGAYLGAFGFALLAIFTNLAALFTAAVGFFFYVVMYSFFKRRSVYGTEIGSIAGAVPIVVGYVAVTDQLDTGALLLFLIMVFWQMPHFYAIAINRLADYTAAGIPVLPVKRGIPATKLRAMHYIVMFTAAAVLLTALRYTGFTYAVVMIGLGLAWFGLALHNFKAPNDRAWAKKLFFFSLIVLVSFSAMISVDTWLP